MSKQVHILNPELVNVEKSQGSYLTDEEFETAREFAVKARKELAEDLGEDAIKSIGYKGIVQAIHSNPISVKYRNDFCKYLSDLHKEKPEIPKGTCILCGQKTQTQTSYGICQYCRNSFYTSLQVRCVIPISVHKAPATKNITSDIPRAARPFICAACGKACTLPVGLKDRYSRGAGALNLCPDCATDAAKLKMSTQTYLRYLKSGRQLVKRVEILENEDSIRCPRIAKYLSITNHGITPPIFEEEQQ